MKITSPDAAIPSAPGSAGKSNVIVLPKRPVDVTVGIPHRASSILHRVVHVAHHYQIRHAIWSVLFVILSSVAGCIGTPQPAPRPPKPDVSLPAYGDLIRRHNANLSGVERVWAFATVELRWREAGRNRYQQGDGEVAVVVPDRLSLSVGKVGHHVLRAGCNGDTYWLFDLREPASSLHHGESSKLTDAAAEHFGLPVRPLDLIRLLGIVPIDPDRVPPERAIDMHNGQYLIEPPGTYSRMLLDPNTARPVRIDLIDARGHSHVSARLAEYRHLKTEGVPPDAWPLVATRIDITENREGGRIKLALAKPIGDADAINARWFDLKLLIRALAPSQVIDLDAAEAAKGE